MFNKPSIFGLSCLALFCGLMSMAEDWRFSIGVNYRTFDDIEYKAHAFRNVAQPTFTRFVNGSIVTSGAGDTITVLDGAAQAPQNLPGGNALLVVQPSSTIALDEINFPHSEENTDEAWGIVLGASRTLEEGTGIRWDLDWTFVSATSSGDDPFSLQGTRFNVTAFNSIGVPDGNPLTPDTQVFASSTVIPPTGIPGSNLSTATVDYEYDLEAYTLAVGVSSNWKSDNLTLSLGVGPSLTIGDLDVERVQRYVDGPGATVPGTLRFTATRTDGDDDFLFGVYGGLGASYQISESIALSLQYRYDAVFSDLTTRIADIDLDGSSGQLKLVFSY